MNTQAWSLVKKGASLWKSHSKAFIVGIVLLLAVGVFTGLTCSCATVGIPDPEVTGPAADVVDALDSVVQYAEHPEMAAVWVNVAITRLRALAAQDLTENDRIKITRIADGLMELSGSCTEPAYLRQRGKSLMILTSSIGLYNTEAIDEAVDDVVESFENAPEPDDEPVVPRE